VTGGDASVPALATIAISVTAMMMDGITALDFSGLKQVASRAGMDRLSYCRGCCLILLETTDEATLYFVEMERFGSRGLISFQADNGYLSGERTRPRVHCKVPSPCGIRLQTRPSSYWALAKPCSADLRNHWAASVSFVARPLPSRQHTPSLYYAATSPCSAAFWISFILRPQPDNTRPRA